MKKKLILLLLLFLIIDYGYAYSVNGTFTVYSNSSQKNETQKITGFAVNINKITIDIKNFLYKIIKVFNFKNK